MALRQCLGALGDLGVKFVVPALQFGGLVLNGVQQLVKVGGQRAQLILLCKQPDPGGAVTVFDLTHGTVHEFDGLKYAARPAQ